MELFKPEFGLVFWMFLAFVCLYFILAKFAWPFIIKIDGGTRRLDRQGRGLCTRAKSHLDNAKAEADQVIAEARKQQADILRDAAKMKSQIIEEAKAEAAQEAKKVTDAAQVAIDQNRKESEKQLRQEVGAYALQIAEQVVRQNMANDKSQRALVEKLLNEVESKN